VSGRDVRLFVAAYPPEDSARTMLRAMRKLGPTDHRETPVGQVHLTLVFIGDTRQKDVEQTIESVERSCSGLDAFELRPTRLVTLPSRGRPRLIACETDAPPTLMELHSRLVRRLAKNPRQKPGDRYVPHLTLCRFGRSAKPTDVDHPVEIASFVVDRVCLMRSVLRSEGAEHREVLSVVL